MIALDGLPGCVALHAFFPFRPTYLATHAALLSQLCSPCAKPTLVKDIAMIACVQGPSCVLA